MSLKKNLFLKLRLCAIQNKTFPGPRAFREKGVTSVQFRDKNISSVSLVKRIRFYRRKFKNSGAFFIVNDRPDACLASGSDGLHVGRGDMSLSLIRKILGRRLIIGKTVRTVSQARAAEKDGADYVSVGPIYRTPLKSELSPRGLDTLKKVKKAVRIPVVAIGGVSFSNIGQVRGAGADGIAMMRGL